MRSAYPAVFLCALACASGPSAARLATTGNGQVSSGSLSAPSENSALRGYLLTGSFATEYFSGETLYDVLRRRAPIYLRPRGGATPDLTGRVDPLAVYIDGNFAGDTGVLNSIPAHEVFAVQRMSSGEAMIRYGPRHSSGALIVTLIRH